MHITKINLNYALTHLLVDTLHVAYFYLAGTYVMVLAVSSNGLKANDKGPPLMSCDMFVPTVGASVRRQLAVSEKHKLCL